MCVFRQVQCRDESREVTRPHILGFKEEGVCKIIELLELRIVRGVSETRPVRPENWVEIPETCVNTCYAGQSPGNVYDNPPVWHVYVGQSPGNVCDTPGHVYVGQSPGNVCDRPRTRVRRTEPRKLV